MTDLSARGILVTGASGALGSSVASVLAERGAKVAGVGLAPGGPGLALPRADLTDPAAAAGAIAQAAEALGGLDGLVNVAGGFVWEKLEGGSIDTFDRMYRLNLRTAAVCCQAAIPHLAHAGGAIVNVGAASAASPGAGMAAYAASKAGVMALTTSLAAELKGKGVRVNAILPTIMDTAQNRKDMPDADTSDWTTTEAAARVIAFLLSADAGAITGASLPLTLRGE
jgi:NAD(P)-dependent dehydrogenase (short-subunit alcohol dehydrogenase family)